MINFDWLSRFNGKKLISLLKNNLENYWSFSKQEIIFNNIGETFLNCRERKWLLKINNKYIGDIWFNSQLINDYIVDEKCLSENPLYKDNIDDLINLHVTKENYENLIALCDYLMVDNAYKLINKIIKIIDYDYSFIFKFKDFYKYKRKITITFEDKKDLKKAIKLYCDDPNLCFNIYGDISGWNVSNVIDMSEMFRNSQFNGDISRWNVSNVIDMSEMFRNSQFNGDISRWNVSNVTNMRSMFRNSQFNGNISNWDVSNVSDMYVYGMF